MKRKQYILAIIVVGVVSVLTALLMFDIMEEKKNMETEMLSEKTTIGLQFEQQLLTDSALLQQVEDFSLPQNILELFQQHKEQLQSFADQCYKNRKGQGMFLVEYINNKPYYFSTADAIRGTNIIEENAIKEGNYDDITAFMNYAIDSQLVFRDWMIRIDTPNPIDKNEFMEKRNSNYGALLSITIYKGQGLGIALLYAPYEDVDYSYEDYGVAPDGPLGGTKIVRIDSHWYYQYSIAKWPDNWYPDPKTLGFSTIE